MKKLTSIMMTIAVVLFFSGSAFATSMQDILNDITVGQDSDVNAAEDMIDDSSDSYWRTTATGGSFNVVVYENANATYNQNTTFGVYNDGVYVELFDAGNVNVGHATTLEIMADGSVFVGLNDTGVDFNSTSFGYYLDSSYYANGGLWHSDTALNSDGVDHMLAYAGKGVQQVQIPPRAAGTWTDNEYILGFEDYKGGEQLRGPDFVVMVESVEPVPEPATLILFGSGLLGLCVYARKRRKN